MWHEWAHCLRPAVGLRCAKPTYRLQAIEAPQFAHLTVAVRDLSQLHDSRERLAEARV